MNKRTVRELILAFINDDAKLPPLAWDDFIAIRKSDPEIECIRRKVLDIELSYPADKDGEWCSEAGFSELRKLAIQLNNDEYG